MTLTATSWLEHGIHIFTMRRLGLVFFLACTLFMQVACSGHSDQPRNMNLKAFDPHRPSFVCKHEADAVPPIDPEAEQWYQQGKAAVTYNKWEEDRDYKLAAQLWAKAAERKHWKAMINLANAYAHGEGVEGDTEKAVQILEQGMQLGIPAAFDAMGIYHMEGLGVKQDASRAYAFWELAADIGSPSAQAYLGAKLLGAYDNRATGMWSNRSIGVKMLECGYVQGNGAAAYELGTWLSNIGIDGKPDQSRALRMLHDGVKFGSADCAGYLSGTFRSGEPMVKGVKDISRADRYSRLGDALERNPALRFPNLDKVLPLPPAELPLWDGKKQTLIDAAKPLVRAPDVQPTPGSQYPKQSRAHIPQGFGLPRNPLPSLDEQAAAQAARRWRPGDAVDPLPGGSIAGFTGYWLPQWRHATRPHELAWNQQAMPLRYAQGEAFDVHLAGMDRHTAVLWHYRGQPVRLAAAAPPYQVTQGIARTSRLPAAAVECHGGRPCPRTGIWYGYLPQDHPLALRYNRWDRQVYLQAGQRFPDPAALQLDLAAAEVRWLWCDNANQPRPDGLVDVTLSDLHDGHGDGLA